MGSWKKHTVVGLFCTIVFVLIFNYFNPIDHVKFLISALVVSFIYSQLPDIDTQASKIRWILTTLGIGAAFIYLVFFDNTKLAILYIGVVIIIWIMGLIRGFGHRGFTHTFISAVCLSCLMFYFDKWLVVVAFINYISHLVVDKQ